MNGKDFLSLVKKTLDAQQDYFAAKRRGELKPRQIQLLIASKELEKQCRAVIADGRLEPDEPQPTVHVYTTEEYQEQFGLTEHMQDIDFYPKGEDDEETN